tara:strand:- start:823 stop:1329 length:507 start_codon:yes stop_codon:yes gene_type:complete
MSFSSGKNAFFISDRSGLKFPYKHKVREWNGSVVAKSEFESKHPQLNPRPKKADAQALRDARPPRTEPAVKVLLRLNPFTTGTASENPTTITVQEHAHGRAVSSSVRFRNVAPFDGITSSAMENSSGFTIASIVDENNYTISVSGTAVSGSIKGGGTIASAGPVTLES